MRALAGLLPLVAASLAAVAGAEDAGPLPRRYAQDLELLRRHVDVVELLAPGGSGRVAVVGAYQGRVMTSSVRGTDDWSLGWVNEDLVASGKTLAHMNPYGGEDRLWFGPEGGQYGLFFESGVPYDLEHWQTPALFDTEPFERVGGDETHAVFRREGELKNRAGAVFPLAIERTVRVLAPEQVAARLGAPLPAGVGVVAFETSTRVTNRGKERWRRETGLPSIWILGMFPPSPGATVVIPFEPGPADERGPVVNDAYFGRVPSERLVVGADALFFRGDGRYRSKIGIPPRRVRPVCGTYDPDREILTIVQFTFDPAATDYVNSMWEDQEEPYGGDVVNSYNDGPPAPGAAPLGPFYEIETSSPALALAPGESYTHVHRTIHVRGTGAELDPVARAVLGVGIDTIRDAFPD